MLGHVECRIQPRNVIALNIMFQQQRIFGEPCQHTARIPDGSAQLGDKRLPGNGPSLRELAVAFSLVFRSAEACNDPLANISAQMQDEIACAVGRRIGPPPNFLFGKLLKTFHDAGEILFRQGMLRTREKQVCGVGYFWYHCRHLASKS